MKVDFNGLPQGVRERIVAITHDGGDQRLVHFTQYPGLWGLSVLAAIAIVVGGGYAVTRLNDSDLATDAIPLFAASLLAIALVTWLLAGLVIRALHRVAPYQPGVFVFASHILNCDEDGNCRITTLGPEATFQPIHKRTRREHGWSSSYQVHVAARDGVATLSADSVAEAEQLARRLYDARNAYLTAVSQGDHQRIEWMNPFYECVRAGSWKDASQGRVTTARVRRVPLLVSLARLLVALALGAGVAWLAILGPDTPHAVAAAETKQRADSVKVKAKTLAKDEHARKMLEGMMRWQDDCLRVRMGRFYYKRKPKKVVAEQVRYLEAFSGRSEEVVAAMKPVVAKHLEGWEVEDKTGCSYGASVVIDVTADHTGTGQKPLAMTFDAHYHLPKPWSGKGRRSRGKGERVFTYSWKSERTLFPAELDAQHTKDIQVMKQKMETKTRYNDEVEGQYKQFATQAIERLFK